MTFFNGELDIYSPLTTLYVAPRAEVQVSATRKDEERDKVGINRLKNIFANL